ncbi:MAG: hypothetical protein AB7F76_08055 [Parvibaculaceae bacterium]
MSHNLYFQHRDCELTPDRLSGRPRNAGPVIYFFAALVIAALAAAWVNAHNRSLPLFGWEGYHTSGTAGPGT